MQRSVLEDIKLSFPTIVIQRRKSTKNPTTGMKAPNEMAQLSANSEDVHRRVQKSSRRGE